MDAQGALRQVGTPTELFARPVDEFVFSFLGMSNFLHVRVQNGAAELAGQAFPLLPEAGSSGDLRVGFRPSDVVLRREGQGLRAKVHRASFLGAFMDYQLEVGGQYLRTALDTHEALANGLLLQEVKIVSLPCVTRIGSNKKTHAHDPVFAPSKMAAARVAIFFKSGGQVASGQTTTFFWRAEVILFLSIAILVIVVVVPVALIFFNAFFVDGQSTLQM